MLVIDQVSLERVLQGIPTGPIRYLDQVGSTNTEALRWADAGAPDLSVVIADEQTAGRGRQGRIWFTPPGAALAFSLVLREDRTFAQSPLVESLSGYTPSWLGRLTALGALAVCRTLEVGYHLAPQIKWPNDVLLERRKVCGILTEAQWQGERLDAVVLGIGINVAPASVPPDSELLYPATCVEAMLEHEVDRWQLLRSVLEHVLAWRSRLKGPEFLSAWEDRLAFKGEPVEIYPGAAGENLPVERGVLLGLDSAGRLRIRGQNGGVQSLEVGELRLRPAGPEG
jgi:BirA family biotin operon repressor/biotin-[acetyl-CoA-carboxylase] ligase